MNSVINHRRNSRSIPFGIMEHNAVIAHSYTFPRIRTNVVFSPLNAEMMSGSLLPMMVNTYPSESLPLTSKTK